MAVTWTQKAYRDGMIEWRLVATLARGEFRPTVSLLSDGTVYAKSRAGYSRQFSTVEEGKAWIAEREQK